MLNHKEIKTNCKKHPKISVLLCCYNYENFVKEAIESVLNQTYTNFELIIADDCSTDNSAKVIKSINDPRIKFIQNKNNLGFMQTRNILLKLVDTEYVAFQDADDVWLPEKLENQICYMEDHPKCAATFTSADMIDESSKPHTKESCDAPLDLYYAEHTDKYNMLNRFFYRGNFLSHSSALLKASVLKDIGEFDERLLQLQDFDYWMRVALKYDVYVFKEKLMYVRRVNNGLSSNNIENNTRVINESMEIIFRMIDGMNKKTFINSFKDETVNQINTELDLLCEKFILLKKWEICNNNILYLALIFYYKYFCKNENRTYLETKYNFSIKNYYETTGKIFTPYPITWNKDYINQVIQKEYAQKCLKESQKLADDRLKIIKDMENSVSWKMTSFLRKLAATKR